MTNVPNAQIRDTLSVYGVVPNDSQCQAINLYISLLTRWNQRISLTTVTDPIEVLRFHFGESLYASVCVPILNGRLADVGSGAGFPGLPLRLFLSDLTLTLIESNMKKAAFLREVIRQLDLARSEVLRERLDNVPETRDPFEFVTARGLGDHAGLLEWSRNRLTASGKVVLWLGEVDATRVCADTSWKWQAANHIPGSRRRFILSGSPSSR